MKKTLFSLMTFGVVLTLAFSMLPQSAAAAPDNIRLRVFVHNPDPRPRQISALCQPTVDDQVNDYGETGWHMPASGVSYRINYASRPAGLSKSQVETAAAAAFGQWSTADSKQIFNYAGTTRTTSARRDGTDAIFWRRLSGGAIAITYTWYNTLTGDVVESDTAFNSRYAWSLTDSSAGDCAGKPNTYDFENIATHEFGHWVGLDDLYADQDRDLTMYGYGTPGELKKDSLGLGDISGALAIAP